MSAARSARLGERRNCPHCRSLMLASQSVCPSCAHHVTFDRGAAAPETHVPFRVEGTVSSASGQPAEYMVTVTVCDERGREIDRHVVGVGAVGASGSRTIRAQVETWGPTRE